MAGEKRLTAVLRVVIVLTAVQTCCYGASWMTDVCTQITFTPPTQPNKPDIPDQWRAKVECKIIKRNITVFVEEFYDYSQNLARARQLDYLDNGDIYYDYHNDEILRIDRNNAGSCQVLDLMHDPNKFLFGAKMDATNRTHVLSPSGALHFDSDYVWIFHDSHEDVRGITCELWSTCQYWPDLDATMNVTWYFSVKTAWDMQIGVRSVPVRAVVSGKIRDPVAGIRDFKNQYDIFDFNPSIGANDFQLQPGDYCPGRVTTKPFPTLPDVFSMVGEIMDYDQARFQTIEEYYDNKRQLNVYKYKNKDAQGTLAGAVQRTEVNDFNEGYAYMINNQAGTCTVGLIEDGNFAFVDLGASHVRQQTPAEFFLSKNVTWEYGGLKTLRQVTSDTWIGISNNMPGYPGKTVRIEWAFASSDYHDWNTGISTVPIPVSARIWTNGSTGADQVRYQYSAYAFTQYAKPFYSAIDISSCFRGSERVECRFKVDNQFHAYVTDNGDGFRAALADALHLSLGISPLRVADILLDKGVSSTTVTFNLLDKAQFAGDTGGLVQNSLSAALGLLLDPAFYNNFQVTVVDGVNFQTVKPIAGSGRIVFSNTTCLGDCGDYGASASTSTGYSGGSLGGLGFAMLLIGGAAGSGGGYFFNLKRK